MHCLKFQVDLENHTNMQQYHTWLPAWPPILDSGSQNTSGRKTPELNLKILEIFSRLSLTLMSHKSKLDKFVYSPS